MSEKLTFEVGNFYVTRDGQTRVLILLIRQGYIVGEIDGDNKPFVWARSGEWSVGIGHPLDLVAEWVPPKKWVVRVYINADGHEFMSLQENSQCKLAGSATVTEGEFAKDTQ